MTPHLLPGPLVLGGGLAGSAVATLLARGGAHVTLIEQHAEPRHKMCGEFLSTEACDSLLALGLDVRSLGAVPVRHLRLAGTGRVTAHDLPFEAHSLTRRVLDEAMLGIAAQHSVDVRRGERVEALEQHGGAWRVRLSGGAHLFASDIFLASGKHDLRGHPRPPGLQGALIAFKQYLRLADPQTADLRGAIELILFPDGYAGLQLVEDGCANLCLLIEARRYKQLGGGWTELLAHLLAGSAHLRTRLSGSVPVLDRPLSLSRIPYGYLRQEEGPPGLWHLGDQAAVIPSFSGDGMSIALHTARVAAELFLERRAPADLTRRLRAELGPLLWRATALSRLMISAPGRSAVSLAVQAMPSLLPRAAALTRIPGRATERLGQGRPPGAGPVLRLEP